MQKLGGREKSFLRTFTRFPSKMHRTNVEFPAENQTHPLFRYIFLLLCPKTLWVLGQSSYIVRTQERFVPSVSSVPFPPLLLYCAIGRVQGWGEGGRVFSALSAAAAKCEADRQTRNSSNAHISVEVEPYSAKYMFDISYVKKTKAPFETFMGTNPRTK